MLHLVGVFVHVTSRPLVMVWGPLPVPKLFFQPKPCCSRPAASGSGATCFALYDDADARDRAQAAMPAGWWTLAGALR